VLLLATGAAFQARASGSDRASTGASSASPFTKILVCGTDKIPYKGSRCRRDMRSTGLVFKEIDCSTRVTVAKKSTFTATIRYAGKIQYIAHTVLKKGKHNELVGVRVNPSKMPGGSYTCSFRLGGKATQLSFQTKGPRGQFLGARVCIPPARRNGICQTDVSDKSITSPRAVMCGGVFVGFAGKSWGAKLVRLTKTTPALVGQYGSKHLPGPISEEWFSFKPKKSPVFRPAKYSCLIFAAGKEIAEHTFTIK
jgi:hypothetical protein